jgi:membrane protease YdiL (CAAX protease family)
MNEPATSEPPISAVAPQIPAPLWRRIWRHPVTQMLARIVFFIAMVAGLSIAMRWLIPLKPLKGPDEGLGESGSELWLRAIRSLVPVVLAYWLLVRGMERRPVSELAPKKFLIHGSVGWLVGMGIMLVAAGVMALAGAYRVHGVNTDVYLVGPLVVLGIVPGIGEEIISRGILFRVVEEGLGTWIALAISAALFGLAHLANPNATAWSSLAIAIEAGLLLGMAYAWTRSLWFVMGLHAAWNFTQGPLLGIAVSGFGLKGVLDSSTQGPALLSGGEFGAEASLLTLIVCVSLGAWFTRKAIAAGRIKPPFWRDNKAISPLPVEPVA